MAYADRTATTGTAIALEFVKLINLPSAPDISAQLIPPQFIAGRNATGFSAMGIGPSGGWTSNMPAIWFDVYNDPAFTGERTGAVMFGASHADYALKTSGTGETEELGQQFDLNGFIDGAYFGLNRTLVVNEANVDLSFYRQQFGEFTGGPATPDTFGAVETQTIDLAISPYTELENVFATQCIPAMASTRSAPVGLFVTNLQFVATGVEDTNNSETYEGLKIGLTGDITKISLFKSDAEVDVAQTGVSAMMAHCATATDHWFVRIGASSAISLTRCTEGTFGTYDYNNYTPKFSDADLPATLEILLTNGDANYKAGFIFGTDRGFLIGYKKLNGSTWEPKFVLVDAEWTTVQHITATAGDATAETILAQGVGFADEANYITMMFEGDYAWLLGGTAEAPLIVEAAFTEEPGETDDVTLRCWAYSHDGHDYYVLRVGISETLVYDLTTGQWAEWQSPDADNWRAHVGCNWLGMATDTIALGYGSDVVAGDDASGVLYILDPDYGRDDTITTGSNPFDRIVTGGIELDGREVVPCGAVTVSLSLGGPTQTGATIGLATSDDLGHTFTSHGTNTIVAGDYSAVVEWRGLGIARAPGRIFRLTDNGAAVRLSAADLR